jgi:hypothetical protein
MTTAGPKPHLKNERARHHPRYFVDVIAHVIRLRLNAHGDLDHAGSILNETQRRAGVVCLTRGISMLTH